MANEKRLIDALGLVIKLAKIVGIMVRNGKPQAEIYRKVLECIADAPTVDAVEVVHGHWEDAHEIKSFRHTNIPVVKCSKCECYFCDIINNHHWFYHYCPNCGAKMDGGNEDG